MKLRGLVWRARLLGSIVAVLVLVLGARAARAQPKEEILGRLDREGSCFNVQTELKATIRGYLDELTNNPVGLGLMQAIVNDLERTAGTKLTLVLDTKYQTLLFDLSVAENDEAHGRLSDLEQRLRINGLTSATATGENG